MSQVPESQERVIFSRPELTLINQTLTQALNALLEPDEHLHVGGGLIEGRVFVRAELANFDRTRVLKLEAAAELDEKNSADLLAARADAIEFLHEMLQEWLEGSRVSSPHLEWRSYEYQGRELLYRGELKDEQADALTAAWLREQGLDEHGEPLDASAEAKSLD